MLEWQCFGDLNKIPHKISAFGIGCWWHKRKTAGQKKTHVSEGVLRSVSLCFHLWSGIHEILRNMTLIWRLCVETFETSVHFWSVPRLCSCSRSLSRLTLTLLLWCHSTLCSFALRCSVQFQFGFRSDCHNWQTILCHYDLYDNT